MLGNADDLAAEVSGSERLWGNSGSNDRLPLLLDAAPYGAMLALAAGSGLVFFRKRRHED